MPDDFTVFHGVHWNREYRGWTHFGEIDFVILNLSGEVLLIEQKNGGLDETGDGLVKHYEDGDKNVAAQIHRSLEKVRQKYQWRHGKATPLAIDYLIYLPEYKVREINAVGVNATRVVDALDKDRLAERIQKILGSGVDSEDGSRERVFDFTKWKAVDDVLTLKPAFAGGTDAVEEILQSLWAMGVWVDRSLHAFFFG